jgi:hypothetical protein
LAIEQRDTPLRAQVPVEDRRIEYNTYRPHSALRISPPVKPTEFLIFRIQLKTLETLDRPTVREETHHATGHP